MADVSIIQQFLHPPLGLLVTEAVSGNPHTGLSGLTRVRGPQNVDAFGLRWVVTFAPPGYGITPRAGANEFDRDVIEIATVHRLFDATLVVSSQEFFHTVAGLILFRESFPWIVDVELAPGVEADLFWLLAL